MFVKDPATQSNYDEIISIHVHFDWSIDWAGHRLVGSATHKLLVLKDGVKEAIFDTGKLEIERASVQGKPVTFSLAPPHEVLGSALSVPLEAPPKTGDTLEVTIFYSTTSESIALGWLDKDQTAGKKFEYLFSQCQPIYARTMAPIQDSSSVKITYSAKVRSVLPALMSAIRVSPPSEVVHGGKQVGVDEVEYEYNQPTAIPSYLIAIASGNLIYKPFPRKSESSIEKWRTGVWTEPELMESAYWEFSRDTASYVHEAEKIITPYEFGVYDLLVLPPSFPYGGMENACLTFVTPTLLAGDRSLVNVVAHEISHSWFGNHVTTADSGHFWLNEGWTRWLETVLLGIVLGPAERDLRFIVGRKALKGALERFSKTPRYRRLVIDFEVGEDPDGAYSSVPYEKGSNFLLYLERLLGGLEVFLPYAQDYVRTFGGKSLRTPEWKEHLYGYWRTHGGEEKIKILDSVDWDAWLYGEGLDLPVDVKYDLTLANNAYNLAEKWYSSKSEQDPSPSFSKTDLDDFTTNQKIVFLERLSDIGGSSLPPTHISLLDTLYGLSTTHNTEIRLRFYIIALDSGSASKYVKEAVDWVVDPAMIKGRMKFCRPTMRAAAAIDKEYTTEAWAKNKEFFHPIARKLVDHDIAGK
ncbi:zincin [Clavulina sp. PMI_390]|nr:zincin [Clavulina sp. PMI_390]